jgi:hypothetical protein
MQHKLVVGGNNVSKNKSAPPLRPLPELWQQPQLIGNCQNKNFSAFPAFVRVGSFDASHTNESSRNVRAWPDLRASSMEAICCGIERFQLCMPLLKGWRHFFNG